jgi:hypothetical protein
MTEAELRLMVREILAEALGKRLAAPAPSLDPEPVRIASDADLQALVARLAAPGGIEAVRAGRLRFVLAGGGPNGQPAAAALALDGVISERRLSGIAKGAAVRLAQGAVMTPLARDLARRMGLVIERTTERTRA